MKHSDNPLHKETMKKLQLLPGIEPHPQWWEPTTLTTALIPLTCVANVRPILSRFVCKHEHERLTEAFYIYVLTVSNKTDIYMTFHYICSKNTTKYYYTLVKGLQLCLWELSTPCCLVLITECHNSHNHSQSLLTN